MTDQKKLRLLLFEECTRSCPGCCNRDWDLQSLPVCRDYSPYQLIMLADHAHRRRAHAASGDHPGGCG